MNIINYILNKEIDEKNFHFHLQKKNTRGQLL